MIHPNTQLRHINEQIGYGVFATHFIPKGTITYVHDALELDITPEQYEQFDKMLQEIIEKYSFIDSQGVRIVSWDHAKYVNHCCNCNTMSTGYGFEIAIRDIHPGEELTDEYGLFNFNYEMGLVCDMPNCRKKVSGKDIDLYYQYWDQLVKSALSLYPYVEQPLAKLVDKNTQEELQLFFEDESKYISVHVLRQERADVLGEWVSNNV
ncbi:MAG: SET domain-containing protein [Saprospiraceae bacterium]|nr:SET domain-containing protein [Saprospiraceae bacterium]